MAANSYKQDFCDECRADPRLEDKVFHHRDLTYVELDEETGEYIYLCENCLAVRNRIKCINFCSPVHCFDPNIWPERRECEDCGETDETSHFQVPSRPSRGVRSVYELVWVCRDCWLEARSLCKRITVIQYCLEFRIRPWREWIYHVEDERDESLEAQR